MLSRFDWLTSIAGLGHEGVGLLKLAVEGGRKKIEEAENKGCSWIWSCPGDVLMDRL